MFNKDLIHKLKSLDLTAFSKEINHFASLLLRNEEYQIIDEQELIEIILHLENRKEITIEELCFRCIDYEFKIKFLNEELIIKNYELIDFLKNILYNNLTLKNKITELFNPNEAFIFDKGLVHSQISRITKSVDILDNENNSTNYFLDNTFTSPDVIVNFLNKFNVAVYKLDDSNKVYISTKHITTFICPEFENNFTLNYFDIEDTNPKQHNQVLQINGLLLSQDTYDDEYNGYETLIIYLEQLIGVSHKHFNNKTALHVNSIWHRIETWLSKNAPTTFNELKPSISKIELDEMEYNLEYKIPDDVKEIYLRHNGDTSLGNYIFISLQKAFEIRNEQLKNKENLFLNREIIKEIKHVKWHKGWLPFLVSESLESMIIIDLAPTAQGNYGQLIYWTTQGNVMYLETATTFANWLEIYSHQLKNSYEASISGRVQYIVDDNFDPFASQYS